MIRQPGVRVLVLAGVLVLLVSIDGRAQRGSAQAMVDNLVNQAQNDPNFDVEATMNRLANDPSLSAADIQKANDRIRAADKKRRQDQNASGKADWNLGLVYRGADYHVSFPLENHCRVPTTVTVTYPTAIPLSGPSTVQLPPKSKVNVEMTLSFKNALQPPPPGPWPLGVDLQCVPEQDSLTITHPASPGGTVVTPAGKYTYTCEKMQRTFSMFLHLHYPPEGDGGGGGGGGGGKPRKMTKTCENLWNYGEFRPLDPNRSTPNTCTSEILQHMVDLFDSQIPALRARAPDAWAWLPSKAALNGMSVEQLLTVKARANTVALSAR